jgi:beta-lactamase class D
MGVMKKIVVLLLLMLAACGEAGTSTGSVAVSDEPTIAEIDLSSHFESRDVEGAFLLYDLQENQFQGFNFPRHAEPYLPASTFKVFNSLVGLETGAVGDEEEIIPWDGTEYPFAVWNQDHSMRSAISVSAVWFYQELARRIGAGQMQDWVTKAEYGNQNINGNIDSFWLDGDLRITMNQQIEFLRHLVAGDLPFSVRSMEIVRDITILDETDDYVLHGKTGSALRFEPQIGWFVGYLETADNVYFFATNIEKMDAQGTLGQVSQEITQEILGEMGLLPE